jgi:hypothetical protein
VVCCLVKAPSPKILLRPNQNLAVNCYDDLWRNIIMWLIPTPRIHIKVRPKNIKR